MALCAEPTRDGEFRVGGYLLPLLLATLGSLFWIKSRPLWGGREEDGLI
jgi:hypothetical protein